MIVLFPMALVAAFLWIGFLGAISFMEAWLKFRAPGITLSLGLGIGRIVFNALNKMEWLFALTIGISLQLKGALFHAQSMTFILPLMLLIIQTIWLLPALDKRAEMHIRGEQVPPSKKHLVYVGMELTKLISLIILGISFFK